MRRPHRPVRAPRNRDPREAGWVPPAASELRAQQRRADHMSTATASWRIPSGWRPSRRRRRRGSRSPPAS